MKRKFTFERYIWFHNQIKSGKYPNRKTLAERFEISTRQAGRDLDFIKTNFNAPFEYCHTEKGFYYSEKSYELSYMMVTENEILGLIIAERLTSESLLAGFKKEVSSYIAKAFQVTRIDIENFKRKISIKNIRQEEVEPLMLEKIVHSLHTDRNITIEYNSFEDVVSQRIVNPLHLLLYKGNWHLLAFCEKRKALRNFKLSGIVKAEVLEEGISEGVISKYRNIETTIKDNYGIFIREQGADGIEVVLKFHSCLAERIKKQMWYPGQRFETLDDGSITLRLLVNDFREITEDILKYGPKVEVLQPEKLRAHLKRLISDMNAIY